MKRISIVILYRSRSYLPVGADIGEFLNPRVNRAFRNSDLEPSIDRFSRFLQGIAQIIGGDGTRDNSWAIGLIIQAPIREFLFAVLAVIDLLPSILAIPYSVFSITCWACYSVHSICLRYSLG